MTKFDEEIEMDWGKLGENPFADARYAMMEYLVNDEELRYAYIANIAMLLHDKYNGADFKNFNVRNKAADDILKLIFEG